MLRILDGLLTPKSEQCRELDCNAARSIVEEKIAHLLYGHPYQTCRGLRSRSNRRHWIYTVAGCPWCQLRLLYPCDPFARNQPASWGMSGKVLNLDNLRSDVGCGFGLSPTSCEQR